jgi:hypothetical protein
MTPPKKNEDIAEQTLQLDPSLFICILPLALGTQKRDFLHPDTIGAFRGSRQGHRLRHHVCSTVNLLLGALTTRSSVFRLGATLGSVIVERDHI